MKQYVGIMICTVLSLLAPLQAGASKAVQQVTATLSTPAEGHEITVNGQTYTVLATPENDSQLEKLHTGDQVEMWVGQPGAAGSPTVNRITVTVKAAAQ